MGIDDVQLDGNPTQREDLSGVASVQGKQQCEDVCCKRQSAPIVGITEPSYVQVYGITGMLNYF
jgi:hypothetical protein